MCKYICENCWWQGWRYLRAMTCQKFIHSSPHTHSKWEHFFLWWLNCPLNSPLAALLCLWAVPKVFGQMHLKSISNVMFIDASEHIMHCKWQRNGREGKEWRGFQIETLSSHVMCKYCKIAITQLCNISSCCSQMFLNIFILFICMIRGSRNSKCLWAPSLLQSLHTALAWACLFILLAACPNTTSRHTALPSPDFRPLQHIN